MNKTVKSLLIRLFRLLRSRPLLGFIRLLGVSKLITLNDPNEIRRVVRDWYKKPLNKQCRLADCWFLLDLNDHVDYRMYMNGRHDLVPLQTADRLGLGEHDILLDIGANVGSVCIPIARRTRCSIVAIEASARIASRLAHNLALNDGIKALIIKAAAVGPDSNLEEPIKLYHNPGNLGASSIFERWNPSNLSEPQVEYTLGLTIDSLDSLCNFDRVKLIKIDVEGAEVGVLQGMKKLIARGVPILFEYRIDCMNRYLAHGGDDILRILESEYAFYAVDTASSGEIAFGDFAPARSYANVLALKKGQRP